MRVRAGAYGRGRGQRMTAALVALLTFMASVAGAQILVDGNIFFENNVSGTLAGQFTGASTAIGAPACPTAPQYSASILGTVTYVENTYTNPLLSGAVYQAGVVPNWRPAAGSPPSPGSSSTSAGGPALMGCAGRSARGRRHSRATRPTGAGSSTRSSSSGR